MGFLKGFQPKGNMFGRVFWKDHSDRSAENGLMYWLLGWASISGKLPAYQPWPRSTLPGHLPVSWCLMLNTCMGPGWEWEADLALRRCSPIWQTGLALFEEVRKKHVTGEYRRVPDYSWRVNWGRQEQKPKVWADGKTCHAWGKLSAG